MAKLIKSKEINGELNKSNNSISIYLKVKNVTPQKIVRGSNHHPKHSRFVGHKPWKTVNLSVEFYERTYDSNGKKQNNKWRTSVRQNAKGTIKPFTIDVYEYQAELLDYVDIEKIYKAILEWINGEADKNTKTHLPMTLLRKPILFP